MLGERRERPVQRLQRREFRLREALGAEGGGYDYIVLDVGRQIDAVSLRALDSLLASPLTRLDEPNAQGETPLMIAAIRGSLPAARRFWSAG